MSGIATQPPSHVLFRPKSLSYRQGRADRAIVCLRATEPVRIAMLLRKVVRSLLVIAADESEMPEVRMEAAKTAYGGADRILDIVGYPKRPVGTAGGKHTVDLRTLLDLTPQAPTKPYSDAPQVKESITGLATDPTPPVFT